MRKMLKRLLVVLTTLALCIAGLFVARHRYMAEHYPYGWSHCCDLGLYLGLDNYATLHDGVFPAGESSPEASLSLLYPELADANLLRGKSVPESVVQAVLDDGKRLGPDTCGWHYAEGLRQDDNPKLALFWDKAGLDHNGGRLAGGGHIVIYLKLRIEQVPAAEWDKFLAEQKQLFEEAMLKRAKEE